jgi:GNAT superfamily N-acetyltransferase
MTAGADGEGAVVVRAAESEDQAEFLALVDALADYERLPRPTAEARARLARDGFGDPSRFRPFVAELEGRIVAYAIVLETYSSFLALPTLYLEDLFVAPDARNRGVARAIFRFLAAEALRSGCGRMEWMVLDWNELAIGFYEGLGARRLGDWVSYRLTREQLEEVASSG